ncbi:MAG: GNAT family N-acetyltransferase [Actinomycetota bacterium]
MRQPLSSDDSVLETARAAALAASKRSGVEVRLLFDVDDMTAVEDLFQQVWAAGKVEHLVSRSLLRALAHSGGYVSGAFRDGVLVGASVGFLARHHGHLQLHSHISGVTPKLQGASVGFALTQHQRAWSLDEGLDEIVWTFDPLVRMNAYFNLTKLGAGIVGYEPNFYGEMPDGINRGDESDRCLVSWQLTSSRAVAAAQGSADPVVPLRDATVILEEDEDGRPVSKDGEGRVLLAWVPQDIVEVRQHDPALASSWRAALRGTFGDAVSDGYTATAMTRAGWYVLKKSR